MAIGFGMAAIPALAANHHLIVDLCATTEFLGGMHQEGLLRVCSTEWSLALVQPPSSIHVILSTLLHNATLVTLLDGNGV